MAWLNVPMLSERDFHLKCPLLCADRLQACTHENHTLQHPQPAQWTEEGVGCSRNRPVYRVLPLTQFIGLQRYRAYTWLRKISSCARVSDAVSSLGNCKHQEDVIALNKLSSSINVSSCHVTDHLPKICFFNVKLRRESTLICAKKLDIRSVAKRVSRSIKIAYYGGIILIIAFFVRRVDH